MSWDLFSLNYFAEFEPKLCAVPNSAELLVNVKSKQTHWNIMLKSKQTHWNIMLKSKQTHWNIMLKNKTKY